MAEGFDAEALHRLIDEAINDPGPRPPRAMPLGQGDAQALRVLAQVLDQHCDHQTALALLSAVRHELLDGAAHPVLGEVHAMLRRCRRCPALSPDPQLPRGNLTAPQVLVIGDGPDPDTGLVEALTDAGFVGEALCYTSLTRCRPFERRAPTDEERQRCSEHWLFLEIEILQPALILTVGLAAATSLLGEVRLGDVHGQHFIIGPWSIVPIFGPSYAGHANRADELAADLTRAVKLIGP